MSTPIVNSPTLPTSHNVVSNLTDFSNAMTLDLTDEEIKLFGELTLKIRARYIERWRLMNFDSIDHAIDELEKFRDELSTTLAERMGLLVTVDGSPILAGEPPIIEVIGKIDGTQFATYGMDHEKKETEVKLATERNEAYLGQKGK